MYTLTWLEVERRTDQYLAPLVVEPRPEPFGWERCAACKRPLPSARIGNHHLGEQLGPFVCAECAEEVRR